MYAEYLRGRELVHGVSRRYLREKGLQGRDLPVEPGMSKSLVSIRRHLRPSGLSGVRRELKLLERGCCFRQLGVGCLASSTVVLRLAVAPGGETPEGDEQGDSPDRQSMVDTHPIHSMVRGSTSHSTAALDVRAVRMAAGGRVSRRSSGRDFHCRHHSRPIPDDPCRCCTAGGPGRISRGAGDKLHEPQDAVNLVWDRSRGLLRLPNS